MIEDHQAQLGVDNEIDDGEPEHFERRGDGGVDLQDMREEDEDLTEYCEYQGSNARRANKEQNFL